MNEAKQEPEPQLERPPQLRGYGPKFWKNELLDCVSTAFQVAKAKRPNYTQAVFAENMSVRVGAPISLALANNWLNGRQWPREPVVWHIADELDCRAEIEKRLVAGESMSFTWSDFQYVLKALKRQPGIIQRHGTEYDEIADIARNILNKAAEQRQSINSIDDLGILQLYIPIRK